MYKSEIAVIIVTYNPNIQLLKHVLSELCEYKVIISDNNSNNLIDIIKLNQKYKFDLIKSSKNEGIGSAQNKAINYINKKVLSDAVFFLDQDSFVRASSLKILYKDLMTLKKKGLPIACLSAVSKTENVRTQNLIKNVTQTISSGMLIPRIELNQVGKMYEDLFIDMIDYEWCWRAKKSGKLIMQDLNCMFSHQIGDNNKVLGKLVVSPFRLYYIFRNAIILVKEGKVFPNSSRKVIFFLGKQFIFNVLFCKQKCSRLSYIVRGIFDGINSKKGKLKK